MNDTAMLLTFLGPLVGTGIACLFMAMHRHQPAKDVIHNTMTNFDAALIADRMINEAKAREAAK